ncbi:MAG TPA: ABC transporter ATP-binding protein [Candidatus Eisenbacteria bacterium]
MITITGLSKSYGAVRALSDVSFTLAPGQICGLLGRNGAGKSTLIRILVGLLPPDAGSLQVDGKPVPFGDITLRRAIGYVPESELLDDFLTVRQFLEFVAAIRELPIAERRADIDRWLAAFRLTDKADALLVECSHGMRRKTSMAGALLGRPRLLLLDEALNGLDPESRVVMRGVLRDFAAGGGTALFSTHVLETAETICDRALIIVRGKIARDLPSDAWRGAPGTLEREFLAVSEPTAT